MNLTVKKNILGFLLFFIIIVTTCFSQEDEYESMTDKEFDLIEEARTYLIQDNYDTALYKFKEVLSEFPDNSIAMLGYTIALLNKEMYCDVIDVSTKVLEIQKSDKRLYNTDQKWVCIL